MQSAQRQHMNLGQLREQEFLPQDRGARGLTASQGPCPLLLPPGLESGDGDQGEPRVLILVVSRSFHPSSSETPTWLSFNPGKVLEGPTSPRIALLSHAHPALPTSSPPHKGGLLHLGHSLTVTTLGVGASLFCCETPSTLIWGFSYPSLGFSVLPRRSQFVTINSRMKKERKRGRDTEGWRIILLEVR